MSRSLRTLQSRVLLLGASAGLCACLLLQSGLHLAPSHASTGWGWAVLTGALFGAVAGGLLAALKPFIYHFPQQTLRALATGAALGLLAGALGWGALHGLYGLLPDDPQAVLQRQGGLALLFAGVLALTGLAAGLGQALGRPGTPRLGQVPRTGLVAGFLAGLPAAAVVAWAPDNVLTRSLGIALWAALVALALVWWEQYRARRWLRVLVGPDEDHVIPLAAVDLTVGKEEENDIPLRGYNEIHPYHCELKWADGHHEIVDTGHGGQVYVNFRQVQSQTLKSGDLVKIGSALLQYGEA